MPFVSDFQKVLSKYSNKVGGKWFSVDFHFHTPESGSNDYKEKPIPTYDKILERLEQENVDVVFITDHNEWQGYEKLKKVADEKGSSTRILPGVELTVEAPSREAKGPIKPSKFHLLALFPDEDESVHSIRNIITNNNTDKKILSQKPTDRIVKRSLEDIINQIHELGGLAIPAHLARGSKPENSNSIDKVYSDPYFLGFLEKGYFDALETPDVSTSHFFDGEHSEANNIEIACVRSSDSHNLASIGSRLTYMKLEDKSYQSVFQSLKYRERILYDKPEITYDYIVGVQIKGNFLKHICQPFNENLVAFIGAKGSGKTSIIECVRFCLGLKSSVPNYPEYLKHILGPMGTVEVLLCSKGNKKYYLKRSAVENSQTECYDEEDNKISINAIIPSIFQIEFKGWNEITNIAQDQSLQFNLVDSFDKDLSGESIQKSLQKLNEEKQKGNAYSAEMGHLFKKRENVENEIYLLKQKKSQLQELKDNDIIELQANYESLTFESSFLTQLKTDTKDAQGKLRSYPTGSFKSTLNSFKSQVDAGKFPNEDQTKLLSNKVTDFLSSCESLSKEIHEKYTALEKDIQSSLDTIEAENQGFKEEYQKTFTSLSPDLQEVLVKRNEIVKETATLTSKENELVRINEQVKEKRKEISSSLLKIHGYITKVISKRGEIVGKINADLKDSIRLDYSPLSNLDALKRALTLISPERVEFSIYQHLSNLFDPDSNSQDVFKEDTFSQVTETMILGIYQNIPSDSIKLKMKDKSGKFRDSTTLSAGQKSTAVLPILLLRDHGPLVLDQPEDNLDNVYIASTVVPTLLERKNKQQIIITSHSGNLVVSSDTEQVIHVSADGSHGEIAVSGFLGGPESDATRSALEVLDGGETAVNRRFKKYGLSVTKSQ